MKKKAALIVEMHDKFYKQGNNLGTRKELLDYVWNVQIKRQLGYSFSMNHCMPYTCICIQCMNLVLKYSAIFWNCACLIVNSGSDESTDNDKNTDYTKIAKAMGIMKKEGINISLPDINKSKYGFYPDEKNNQIIYGLKPIQGVGSKIAKVIIENRPYTSLEDFYQKMQDFKNIEVEDGEEKNKFGDMSIIALIKSGCFDNLEKINRKEIMEKFIKMISNPIKSLTLNNIEDLNNLGLLTEVQKKYELRLFRFRKYIFDKKFFVKQTGKSASTNYYKLERKFAEPYFYENFETYMTENKDYEYSQDGFIIVKRGSIERVFEKLMVDFKEQVLNNKDFLNKVNEARFKKLWESKVPGSLSKWEMDSLCIYYGEHELAKVNRDTYNISNFETLPVNPVIVDNYYYRGQPKPRYKLTRVCGTVLGRDKNKHIVTLLTPDGVVNVKFYKGQFTFYDKQISQENKDSEGKTVLEKSWFSRGTKLLITGFRRDEQFIPKKYKDSVYQHSVQLIIGIKNNGENLILQSERIEVE